ncbi:protein of unknown function [Nakamurella panacisegetis]|uniref:DUF4191 domain-containing protein n=1 Tax=Nakamurella panacisegetis TaxID=1090615 RepID=A0A1H0T2W2_9ACTN|nr:DUF4191 domain-containing protein [Nakamurella panacisegetis]SDP47888.1 protein of unknown function [Nakamurella panacisegetis]
MAKTSSTSPSLSKEEKKAAKVASRAGKKERRGQIWQAFQMQRKEDKRLLPYMIACLVGSALVFTLLGWWLASWWAGLVFGLIIGAMIAMIFFARRVQSNVYKQADGTPGAAAWSLQNNQLRGKWRITPAVAGTSHLDAVHRVVGRPGIILIGEGATHRVKPLLAQEKKKIARVVGDTPIYDIIVGNEEGQTPLKKLNQSLMRLPRNITVAQVSDLDGRLSALSARVGQQGMPKGPLSAGAKTRNVQRAARRR